MLKSYFPILTEQTKKLPLYITTLGSDSFQKRCCRENGFFSNHIIIVTKGHGIVECQGRKEYLSEGDMFFIKKFTPHSYYASGNVFSTIWVTFNGNGTDDILSYFNINSFHIIKNADYISIVEKFNYLAQKTFQDKSSAELSAYLYSFIVSFFSQKIKINIKTQLEKSIKYINENYSKCITLDELAEIADMNKYIYCREFKATYSITAFEFVIHERIRQSKKILMETSKKISEIALSTGFNDTGYFCRSFKKIEGISPTEFRNTFNTAK